MLSVIIPTHNPNEDRLARTMAALRNQNLAKTEWELIIVDNASNRALSPTSLELDWHPSCRVVREESLGLTSARARGFAEASGGVCVLVDDDNLLCTDYLSQAARIAEGQPEIGVFGGKSIPEFESPPPEWLTGLSSLLALRDDGDDEVITAWGYAYPDFAPIGAGLVVRRDAALKWISEIELDPRRSALDRAGEQLVSGGDNDIVISVMRNGGKMGYFPSLVLTHLIPTERCNADYLARLNHSMSKSWMQLLTIHGINPWPQIPAWTVPLRKAKAWLSHRAWSNPAARILWAGACGHFEGRTQISIPPAND